jgi:chemotaxis protein histidine kinase CheA
MASPKPTAKPSNAPATESVFAAMKKQSALAKNMAKAKKVVAVREFDGPDGDYNSNLTRLSHYTKDGTLGAVLEFRCVDEGDYEGQKMVVFFSFKTTDRETATEVQNRFFETIQLCGVSTDVEDDAQLDKAIKDIIESKSVITLRVKEGKRGGKFINVVGVADAAKQIEDTEYVEETTEEETTDVATEEEAVDEWEEETTEEEAVEEVVEEVEEESNLPSAWVGYAMVYKGTEVEVLAANDAEMKCTIKHGTKKIIVPFSALSAPAQ